MSVDNMIERLSYNLPYNEKDLREVYKQAQLDLLLELNGMLKGYPVNGLVRGIITEEQITDKLVEVMND